MNLLKISFLLFSTTLHVQTSNTKKNAKPWQYNTRKVNGPSDDYKNCFCYPEGNLPTVHQLLDPQENGQERIVIYLYRNVGSNEIKMYTPSADKQVLIPDLPYESDDGLVRVTTENIPMLFYSNPYRIKIYNNRFEKINPALVDSLPIGLNLGAVEHVYPNNENNVTPKNNVSPYGENGNLVNGPQKGWIKNIPGNVILNQWTTPEGEHSNDNPEVIEQYWLPNKIKYPYKNPQVTQNNLNPNIGELDEHVYTFQTNDGSYNLPTGLQSTSTEQDVKNPLSERYVTFTIWFNRQIKRFQKIHLPHDLKDIDNNVLKFLVLKTLSKNNIHVSAEGVIINSNGLVIDAANLELRPLLLGEKINYQILQNSRNLINLPKYLPYLEGILVTLVHPPQVLGIIPLGKTNLLQAYYRESLNQLATGNVSETYLNSYGNGNMPSYSSASKGPYTYVVKETYSGATTEPVNSYAYSTSNGAPISSNSYSNVYREPSSSSYSYSSVNKEPSSGTGEVTYWSSGPYSTVSKEPYLTANWNPAVVVQPWGERRQLTDAKIKHHYEPPKARKKGKGLWSETFNNSTQVKQDVLKEGTIPEPVNVNTSESGRRFSLPSLKGIIKTLLYLLNDLPTRRDGANATEVDIVSESENHKDGDGPDFRIIGGNAATGSGTPLNNKGRSGYNE